MPSRTLHLAFAVNTVGFALTIFFTLRFLSYFSEGAWHLGTVGAACILACEWSARKCRARPTLRYLLSNLSIVMLVTSLAVCLLFLAWRLLRALWT